MSNASSWPRATRGSTTPSSTPAVSNTPAVLSLYAIEVLGTSANTWSGWSMTFSIKSARALGSAMSHVAASADPPADCRSDPWFTHQLALRLKRLARSIESAAREGSIFHLWWHPHNFGLHLEENLAALTKLAEWGTGGALGVLGWFINDTALDIVALNAADHLLHLASAALLIAVAKGVGSTRNA